MKNLNALDWIALILIILGGLNWGLIAVLNFDLIASIFGNLSTVARIIYAIVGLSAIYTAIIVGRLVRKE